MKKLPLAPLILLFAMLIFAQSEMLLTLQGDGETPSIEHIRSTCDNRDYEFIEQYTDPGAVIFHDGKFHMFRNGFRGWPAPVWIHYMVSDDGITWEQPSNEPILHSDDVPYADIAALASSVIVQDDGTWVLYFYTWNSSGGSSSEGSIGRATATNPEGPWTVDDEALFPMGEAGSFDEKGIAAPQVIKTEDGYLMYYDGIDASFVRTIGLASSEDGVTWEKYADNPIIEPEQSWEGRMTHQARVVTTDTGYLMIYRTATGTAGGMRLGYATSTDGIGWERASEPILAPTDLENHRAFYYTALTELDGTLYLFIELMPANNVTDIFTMTVPVEMLMME